MKVVHFLNSDPINHSELGGINNVVYNLAINQSKVSRVEICGITHIKTGQQKVNRNLTFHNVKRNLLRTSLVNYVIKNKSIFLKEGVVYHLHNVYVFEYFLLVIFLKNARITWVITPHSGYDPQRFRKKGIFNLLVKKLYFFIIESYIIKNVFKIHATGPQEELDLKKTFPQSKVQFIPNGINQCRDTININSRPGKLTTIGYFGRIDIHQKGLDILMRCMKVIINKRKDIKLHLIGYGKDATKLKELAEKFELQDFISFKGPKFGKEKFISLKQLQYFIQLSRYESFPITILEAASVGLPLITSVGCGFKDVIAKYHNGIVIESESIDKISEAIVEFIDSKNETEYKEMSQNSLNMITENYTWDKIVPNFSDYLYK